MSHPILLAVDENENSLLAVERELRDRYERRPQSSMNRVASAVGEGSIAVQLVHDLFAVERLA